MIIYALVVITYGKVSLWLWRTQVICYSYFVATLIAAELTSGWVALTACHQCSATVLYVQLHPHDYISSRGVDRRDENER